MGNYTKPRFGAIAAGTLCALGAAAVLVEDVRHTHTVTLDHLLAVIVLVGTIAAGVMAVGMLKTWRTWHYAAALAALAAIGSLYCMMGTAGRTAETRAVAKIEAEAREARRAEILAARQKDQDRLDKKREEHAAECKTGRGKRCDGILESLKVYEAAVKGHNADLAELGPEVPVNTRVKNAAAILGAIRGADADQQARIEATLTLIEPNIPAAFLEAGSIVFLHIGLAGVVWSGFAWPWKRQARPLAAISKPAEQMTLAELAALQHLFRDDDPTPPKPRKRAKPEERRKAVADFRQAFVKKHGYEPQPADIRAGLGLPRRASHSYLREQVPA